MTTRTEINEDIQAVLTENMGNKITPALVNGMMQQLMPIVVSLVSTGLEAGKQEGYNERYNEGHKQGKLDSSPAPEPPGNEVSEIDFKRKLT